MTDLIRYRCNTSSQGTLFTAYYSPSGAANVADCQEAANRVHACMLATAGSAGSILAVTFDAFADVLDQATGQLTNRIPVTAPSFVTGSSGGDNLATRLQYLFTYRTGVFIGGREVVGRSFVPGPTENQEDSSGHVAAGTVTSLSAAAGLLGTTITTPLANVVWHRPVIGAGGQVAAISSWSCAQQFAQMRSRRS